MKQNITLSVDKGLLKRVREIAAQRGRSVSELVTHEMQKLVDRQPSEAMAKARALADLLEPIRQGVAPPSRPRKPGENKVVSESLDITLTADDARKLRRRLKQVGRGKAITWSPRKNELDL